MAVSVGAPLDDGDATGKLCQALLKLFLVVVRLGLLDLLADLADAGLDLFLGSLTANDGRVVLVDLDFVSRAKHVFGDLLEGETEVFAEDLAARKDGDVLQHGLAPARSHAP